MMGILYRFLYPYVQFAAGAGWNIEQTFEGLGWVSSNFITRDANGHIIESYWSPWQMATGFTFLLLVYCSLLAIPMLVSAYVIGRKRGILIAFALLLLPGILSVFDLMPEYSLVPEVFVIGGTGNLGSELGILPLVLIGTLTGWCTILILVDVFGLADKFRHAYDHIWFATAILAGFFFVADLRAADNLRSLQEENRASKQGSAYLLHQVIEYQKWCQKNPKVNRLSCQWVSDVQQKLNDYATWDERLFFQLGPMDSLEIYKPIRRALSDEDMTLLRKELIAYNLQLCPVQDLGGGMHQMVGSLSTCQMPPAEFCHAYPDPIDGKINRDGQMDFVAIANECIVPTLVQSRKSQEKQAARVESDRRSKHLRWLFYLAMSVVVGGKIANSTTRLVDFDRRSVPEQGRVLHLLKKFSPFFKVIKLGLYKIHAIGMQLYIQSHPSEA